MITAVRLTPSSDNFPQSFDLTIEGLNRLEARSLVQKGHDLMLGDVAGTVVPDVSAPRPNPLAEVTVDAQMQAAVICHLHMYRFSNKINTIKMLRCLFPGMGLKDSKDFVEFADQCSITAYGQATLGDNHAHLRPNWVKF
jgi:ribosomal protein L7/L12